MRSDDPFAKRPAKPRPEIWASGGQRPPFSLRALGRGGLFLSRDGVAALHAWAARRLRRVAVNVKNGAGRIPAEKLGRAERFVPSHLRVAGWIKNTGATLAHASATADTDIRRGNALVAEIEPHLWDISAPLPRPEAPAPGPTKPGQIAPVVLPEPQDDPLAAIRGEMARGASPVEQAPAGAGQPPGPPGAVATGVIQVAGYAIGWASVAVALPYGLVRALWQWVKGHDLKAIGRED
jgi:hypothetical protein